MDDLDELKAELVAQIAEQFAEIRQELTETFSNDKKDKDNRLKCSFCGKAQDRVKKLISGPGVYICNECVYLCNEIMDEELFEDAPGQVDRAIDRLSSAKGELLRVLLRDADKWMARRVADNSVGVQVLVGDDPLGANLEEQVLYASALEALVGDRLLVKCSQKDNETAFQLTWEGLLEARRLSKTPESEAGPEK